MRNCVNFNTDWRFAKTGEIPGTLPENWERVTLPHTWNAIDGQDGGKKGVNQKGLVTMDRKLRKDAFYLYNAA